MFTVILLEHMVIHSFLSDQTPFQSDLRNYRLISLSFRAVKTLIFWKTGKQREYNWQVNLKSFRTSLWEMFKNPWLISCKCTGEFNSAKISTQNIYQYRGYWWEEKKKKKRKPNYFLVCLLQLHGTTFLSLAMCVPHAVAGINLQRG